MSFSQLLDDAFYRRFQSDIRMVMDQEGIDLLLLDAKETLLDAGMVCSSEPAPYVCGFRLAGTVLVTASGPESMTRYTRNLEEIFIA